MLKVLRVLGFLLVIPVIISLGIIKDEFLEAFDSSYSDYIFYLLILPMLFCGIAYLLDYSNSLYNKISFYLLGLVFILFGLNFSSENILRENLNRRNYWQNVELSDVPRENEAERSKRENRLWLTKEYKILKVDAKELELKMKIIDDYDNFDSYILVITGVLLVLLNLVFYRLNKTLK